MKTTSNFKILYVEDDSFARTAIEKILKRRYQHVFVAENGSDGLDMFYKINPDIVISDIKMPIMDGLQMIREINKSFRKIKIILTTAHSDSDILINSIDAGIDHYILKPIEGHILFSKIDKCIYELGLEREVENQNKIIKELNKKLSHKVYQQINEIAIQDELIQLGNAELSQKDKKLQASEKLYITTINSLTDFVLVFHNSLRVVFANDSIRRFNKELGITVDPLSEKINDVNSSFGANPLFSNSVIKDCKAVIKQKIQIKNDINISINNINSYYEYFVSPVITDNEQIFTVITFRDITERKNMEQQLLRAVIETEEVERQRFAGDLHDGLGPLLFAIKIYMSEFFAMKRSEEETNEIKTKLLNLTADAVTSTREISHNLTVSILNERGLIKALTQHINNINSLNQIHIELRVAKCADKFNYIIEVVLYRILLELINNTLKHSKANKAKIKLARNTKEIIVEYTDNGIGFDMQELQAKTKKGIGLGSVQSRLQSILGNIDIWSEKEKGMKATILIPYK